MSKRHSEKIQMYNNTEATKEQIWAHVESVWDEMSSAEVAKSFVHAYRIMQTIIEARGNNHWLAHGTPHCNVRRDFVSVNDGIRRKFAHAEDPVVEIERTEPVPE